MHVSPFYSNFSPTFFPNNQLVVVEIRNLFCRRNFPQKFFSKFSLLDKVNAIERRRVIFPPLSSTTLRSILDSFDFNSPPMPGWNVIASLPTTSLESNSSRDEAIKSTARLSFPTLQSATRVSNACPPINYRFCPRVSSFWDDRENEISRVQFFSRAKTRHDRMFIKNIVTNWTMSGIYKW